MLKLIIVTPKGEVINEEFDGITANGDQGEIGILENRLPIIIRISDGFVKAYKEKKTVFACINHGILDNDHNVVTIVCNEACLGETLEEAKANLDKQRELIKSQNKQHNVDFATAEKDLAKAIKESKASEA